MLNYKPYKRRRRTAVELTSLLDLLFVMIFVSLLQQKDIPPPVAQPAPEKIAKSEVKVKTPEKTKHSITATFSFYPTAQNPRLPSGSYIMQGSYNSKSRRLKLGGTSWIDRPANYDMVPLSGVIEESGALFTGRIEFIGCKKFTLKRVESGIETPISGIWKGTYNCSQGFTGLTLSIE